MRPALAVLALALVAPLFAQTVLTLDELIELSLINSPDINISRSDFEAARQRTRQAKSGYLPQLDALAAGGATGIKYKETDEEDSELLAGSLTASQLLFDFGKTTGDIEAFGKTAEAYDSAYQQAIADKVFAVKRDYYTLLRAKSLIAVNEENVKLNEQQLYRSQKYFKAGIRTKIDVTDARVRLISARLALQNADYDLRLARVALEKTVGIMPLEGAFGIYEEVPDQMAIFKTLPDLGKTLAELEAYAFEHRHELKSYANLVESAKAQVTSIKGDYYPMLFAYGRYDATHASEEFMRFTPEQQWQATLNLRWNLFSGFRTDAATEEAQINVNRASSEYLRAKLAVKQETDDAFILVMKNKDGIDLSESLAVAAKEKFGQAQKRYEYGLTDFIELQQARQEYIDALSQLYVSYFDYYIALAELDRAIGR
jgi:outer membrane protein